MRKFGKLRRFDGRSDIGKTFSGRVVFSRVFSRNRFIKPLCRRTKYMGEPFTEYLKNGEKVLSI